MRRDMLTPEVILKSLLASSLAGRTPDSLCLGIAGSSPVLPIFYSTIAQLVEQKTVNLLVPGSSPGGGAIFNLTTCTFKCIVILLQ